MINRSKALSPKNSKEIQRRRHKRSCSHNIHTILQIGHPML
jgi:hypothetical protein